MSQDSQISRHMNGLLKIYFTEGYYDEEDFDNPIKYRLIQEVNEQFRVTETHERRYYLNPNLVVKLDGTSEMFFSYEMLNWNELNVYFIPFYQMTFYLGYKYTVYTQYVNYRIMSGASGTLLEAGNKMSQIYTIGYLLAQFGGFYCALHILFGMYMHKYVENSYQQDIVNAV